MSGAVAKVARAGAIGALMCLAVFAAFEVMGDETGAAVVVIAVVLLALVYVIVASRGSAGGSDKSDGRVSDDVFQWWDWTTFGIVVGAFLLAVALSSLFPEPWKWPILGFVATAGGSFADARNRRRSR